MGLQQRLRRGLTIRSVATRHRLAAFGDIIFVITVSFVPAAAAVAAGDDGHHCGHMKP